MMPGYYSGGGMTPSGMSGLDEEKVELLKAQAAKESAAAERLRRGEDTTKYNIQAGAQKYASDAALRLYERKRDDTPSGYKKGGPVIKGEFKHANPTYTKYGKTGDSSLLAKGRK